MLNNVLEALDNELDRLKHNLRGEEQRHAWTQQSREVADANRKLSDTRYSNLCAGAARLQKHLQDFCNAVPPSELDHFCKKFGVGSGLIEILYKRAKDPKENW